MIKTIMPTRMNDMQQAIECLDRNGIIGIAYYDKYGFENFARGADDKGLYFFAQVMHKIFNLNLEQIIILFHIVFIGVGFIAFCIGWMLFLKTNLAKIVSVAAVSILSGLVYVIGDVYIMFYFMSSFVPLFLYLIDKNNKKNIFFMLVILACFSVVSHIIRSYSFVPTVLFVLIYLFFNLKSSIKYYYISFLILSIFAGYTSYKVYENSINNKLIELNADANLNTKHVFWHSVYIGLGYVDNEYIPHYLDEVAMQKVHSIDPSIKYLSKEYEEVLKNETFKFIKEHKMIAMQNFGAKFGVMLLYFLIFSNIGFYCFYASKNRKNREFFLPCLCALCFNAIFGFLVVPSVNYLLGFVSFSVIFAIYYIDNYINEKGFST